ncbi:hypothetical protein NHX12_025868 [Muraenolepis orangiensis]|uniref:Ig-like domain-containing protein n=1 Tax=Muraenolepis orangiensis TaxID=630683 RepID=A0A9Q0EL47_9TELE|nr:hypothetical protein NHX12_025868 [Muraenolepis orangiensis]
MSEIGIKDTLVPLIIFPEIGPSPARPPHGGASLPGDAAGPESARGDDLQGAEHPSRVLRFEWRLSNQLLHAGAFTEHKDQTEYTVRSLNREGWGEYTCNVFNEAGTGKCTFHVTGRTSD